MGTKFAFNHVYFKLKFPLFICLIVTGRQKKKKICRRNHDILQGNFVFTIFITKKKKIFKKFYLIAPDLIDNPFFQNLMEFLR